VDECKPLPVGGGVVAATLPGVGGGVVAATSSSDESSSSMWWRKLDLKAKFESNLSCVSFKRLVPAVSTWF